MRVARSLVVIVIVGLFAVGAAFDLRERPQPDRIASSLSSVTAATGPVTTWFCPGGAGRGGIAEFAVELISASHTTRSATVTAAPDSSGLDLQVSGVESANAAASSGARRRGARTQIGPGERVVMSPSDQVPDALWVGAVVDVDASDVVVEQVLADGHGGVGRSACLTTTSDRWVVPHGATRVHAEGERFVVMLLNPFPDFAVAEIEIVADVGRDSVEGLVIPAGSVAAVDVTGEITVASSVSLAVHTVSGRLATSWLQLVDGPSSGHGTRVATASPELSELWYLPVAGTRAGRKDVVSVVNRSADRPAEVDLEIIADDPDIAVNPIQLTIPPERTAVVDLSAEARLNGLDSFTVVVRSLAALAVASSIHSITDPALAEGLTAAAAPADAEGAADGDSGPAGGDSAGGEVSDGSPAPADLLAPPVDVVVGTSAMAGADAAASHWLLPVAVVPGAGLSDAQTSDFSDDVSHVVIINPSEEGIALIELSAGGETVRSLELGPLRRARVPLDWLGSGRFVLEVEATSPVIAASELVGLTSRTASIGVAASEPVLLSALR